MSRVILNHKLKIDLLTLGDHLHDEKKDEDIWGVHITTLKKDLYLNGVGIDKKRQDLFQKTFIELVQSISKDTEGEFFIVGYGINRTTDIPGLKHNEFVYEVWIKCIFPC